MPYVYFKFKPGNLIYVKICASHSICGPSVFGIATVRRMAKHHGENHYRLSDGQWYKETELRNLEEYQLFLKEENAARERCLEESLANL